jgi:V8-like Glu-specific endopeptidase
MKQTLRFCLGTIALAHFIGCEPDSVQPDVSSFGLRSMPPSEVLIDGRRFQKIDDEARPVGASDSSIDSARPMLTSSQFPGVTYIAERDPNLPAKLEEAGKTARKRFYGRDTIELPLDVPDAAENSPDTVRGPGTDPSGSASCPATVDPTDPWCWTGCPCTGYTGSQDTRLSVTGSARTSHPYAAQIYMETNDGSRCSGTMIGRNTMLTAAHCLMNSSNGQWKYPTRFVPAFDVAQSPAAPFGEFTCWTVIGVPGNYPGSDYVDYGVVTFDTCGSQVLGDHVGWLGWWTNPPTTSNQQVEMYGYPGTYSYQTGSPQLAGHVGGAWPLSNGVGGPPPWYYSATLDGSKGQSGAAWYRRDPDGFWVIGEYSEIQCPTWNTSGYNQARRIDSTVESFIVSVSPDW